MTSLIDRVRAALTGISGVEEKRMFGGTTFMVNGKMCVSAGRGRLMCRIDPATHDRAIRTKGCRTVTMKGREYRGYVHVDESAVRDSRELRRWIDAALRYNASVVSSSDR